MDDQISQGAQGSLGRTSTERCDADEMARGRCVNENRSDLNKTGLQWGEVICLHCDVHESDWIRFS